jgi:hypothetical protein
MISKAHVCLTWLLLLTKIVVSEGQEIGFQKTFRYSRSTEASEIIACKDHGYLIVGSVFNPVTNDWDFYASKISSGGKVIWKNKYGIAKEYDKANAAAELSDGSFLVIARSSSPLCFIKINKDGKIISSKGFNGNDFFVQHIKEVKGEGFMLHGYYNRINPERNGVVLMMLNQSLEITWTKYYENIEPGNVRGAFTITKDNGCMLAYGNGAAEYGNLTLIKTDKKGNIEWGEVLGDKEGLNNLRVYDAETLSNGDVVISGNIKSQRVPVLVKINSEGELIWASKYNGFFKIAEYVGVHKNSNDEIVFCSVGKIQDKRDDVFLTKIDAAGKVLWSKAYGTSYFDNPRDFQTVKDSSYIILALQSDTMQNDFYIIKTGFGGRSNCNEKDVSIFAHPVNFSFLKDIKVEIAALTGGKEVQVDLLTEDAGMDIDICPPAPY